MKACISIDLEELDDSIIWYNSDKTIDIELSVEKILSLLDKYDMRATFFVLGTFAEKYPGMVKTLRRKGHEIGSHFYSHKNLYELDEKGIEDGIKKSRKILGKVSGFRAPMYTMDLRTIKILKINGFKYDSSVFPSILYPHPSVKKIDRKFRIRALRRSGPYEINGLMEIPLTVFPSYLGIPVTGTSIRIYGNLIARLVRFFMGDVFVINVHPFEFLEDLPKYANTPFWFQRNAGKRFEYNLNMIIKSLTKHKADFVKMEELV